MKNTIVNFLYHPQEDDLFALFPSQPEGLATFRCYSHEGQHSECDLDYARECKKATKEQYKDLLAELTSIGYIVKVKPFNHF